MLAMVPARTLRRLLIVVFFGNRLSFAHADDVYSLMENIVNVAISEIQLPDNNGFSTTYPSLNRCSGFLSFVCDVYTFCSLFMTVCCVNYFSPF